MIKLLLVEDEVILREGISRVGKWSDCGIEICGQAANGEEALALIKHNRPDIVLTDVKMPVMDGIELTKRLYEQYPDIKVIILSGHDEFEYAKHAIEYKACNYLLKPAKIEKIEAAVIQARDEILTERRRSENEAQMRQKLKESLPVLREHYMNRLIAGTDESEAQVREQLDFLEITLADENLAVLVCELDQEAGNVPQSLDRKISGLQLGELCREVISKEYSCCVFTDMADRVVAVIHDAAGMKMNDLLVHLLGKATRIQNEMTDQYGKSVSVGIGRPARRIRNLNKAYNEAVTALAYKFFMGSRSIIYIGDVEQKESDGLFYLEQAESEILVCLKTGDTQGTRQQTERYFRLFEELMIRDTRMIYEEITVFISNVSRALRAKEQEDSTGLLTALAGLMAELRENRYPTLRELQERVSAALCQTADCINQDRLLRSEGLIDKAKKYVNDHLSQDVSLITVADSVYISPNYLSFLFKESGENFKDYVLRIKMQKVEELLDSGQYNYSQIAYALGYKDGRYLSQVYKKYRKE